MSSSDVRDVLNLSEGAAGARPTKKQKLSAPRPNLKGLAREVHNLGGDNPIAIVPEVSHFKKRRFASRKPAARWEMRSFKNSARDDNSLILKHWRRIEEKQSGQAPTTEQGDLKQENETQDGQKPPKEEMEDSSFAKFNAQVTIPQYSDDQYNYSLKSETWSKEETDHLISLAREFDLRWPLIWDRYEWNPPAADGEANEDGDESKAVVPGTKARTMEDLKARYYEVASKMMAVQKPVQYMTQPEFSLHELMAHFNPEQEKLRKNFALNAFTRSRDEAREEESLLLEIKRILARSERFNEERRELYHRLDYPHAETDISNFKSSAGLQTLLGTLMNATSKKRKTLPGPDGASPANPATQPAAAAQEPGRRDSSGPSTGNREPAPAGTPTAGNNKKGQPQPQQPQPPTERPKLTEKEEAIYGVSHHDRLGSGPTFRTEKINKLFSHKSNQQQLRINNTLNELDVPSKLAMPTSATTAQYEQLLGAVNSLLEARKVSDKLDGEIKVELAKKAEREKTNAVPNAPEEAEASKEEAQKEENAAAPTEPSVSTSEETSKLTETETEKAKSDTTSAVKADGDKPAEPEGGDKATEEKPARPGSSGVAAHKRSASVLSTASDKSSKRQKK